MRTPPLGAGERAAAAAAIETNLFELAALFSFLPGAETGRDDAGCWTLSGVPFPFFNSVVATAASPERADVAIERVVARARRRGVPVLWWIGPSTRPADLGARLERHGFERDEPAPGMLLELAHLPARGAAPAGLVVERVSDAAALAAWVTVMRIGFGIESELEAPWRAWLSAVGLGDDSPFRHFLARLDGVPVATASVLLAAGVAGVYNVATLPAARRRGCGAEVTRQALAAARDREGQAWSILHSSPMGLRVYRALGFRAHCRIGVYFWMG